MGKTTKPMVEEGVLWWGEGETAVFPSISLDSSRWIEWLSTHQQFKFKGSTGHFSARRETRHGSDYWYAYRRRSGKLHKVYLGKSEELTLIQLEEAAATLAGKVNITQLTTFTVPPNSFSSKRGSHNSLPALTKFRPPILPPSLITRPRLNQKINSPVTLICAPGGFGKSTLLNAWQQERSDMPVAWVALEADDNHLLRFWSTVVMALQTVEPGLGKSLLPYLQVSSAVTPAEIVARLTNEIISAREQVGCIGLVLDDYHHIQHPDIHQSIQAWLEHMPPVLQLIISGRTRPPIALGCLRSRGLVTELEMEDLRFTLEEGIEFLQQHIAEQPLAYGDMETLVKRTGGWAAGLMLAVLALNKQQDRQHFLDSFNGAHIFLREYFLESVLHQQPAAVQTFLLKTSILKQLTGGLCDAVTGQSDGAQMLDRLWQENLFMVRSEESTWYHYHDLFGEMLGDQLQTRFPGQIPALHRRAAAWYRKQNAPADAVRHLLAIEDWEEAASLIEEEVLHELMEYGEDSRLLRWIQQLPEAVVQRHKTLLFVYLRLAKLALHPAEVERFLQRLETNLIGKRDEDMTQDELEVLSEVRTIRQHRKANDRSTSPLPPETDDRWQLLDALLIVETYRTPKTTEAGRLIHEIYEKARIQKNLFVVLIAGSDCANRAYVRGQLRQSEKLVYQVLQDALSQRGKLPEPSSIVLATLSQVCLARNELNQADELLQRATMVDPNPVSSNMPVNIAVARAKLQSARDNHEAARATIQAARSLQAQHPSSVWSDQDLATYEAMFCIALENWREAERLLNEGADEQYALSQLVRAELLLKQKQAAAAEELLGSLMEQHPQGILNEPLMGARVLLALALYGQHKLNQTRQVLLEAVRLAAPERFIRPFLNHGTQLIPLLALLLHTETLADDLQGFIRTILDALGCPDETIELLPEEKLKSMMTAASVTEREQEVLKLVSDGLSNREIGMQLCISPGTVKTHLANVYEKLNVHSRVQAVVEARALKLI
ncbi:MAG: hypothetical protein H6659_02125 [Ardenticatenaceae bacterium]|nr:hypothetical protein [Ardenticatenaceae bacterium]